MLQGPEPTSHMGYALIYLPQYKFIRFTHAQKVTRVTHRKRVHQCQAAGDPPIWSQEVAVGQSNICTLLGSHRN